jgi:hypothetical protein
MNNWKLRIGCLICVAVLAETAGLAQETGKSEEQDYPHFQEVLRLIRANLPDVAESELNAAMVEGLISQFRPRVELMTSSTPIAEIRQWITRAAVYEETVGYLQLNGVGPGLPEELSTAWAALQSTNRLDALIVDLRFAQGQDYSAAAKAADLFVRGDKPLLAWDDTIIRSTGRTGDFLPVAVLVNGETKGAAEAMAAALRESGSGLVLGSRTPGQAYMYREFGLNGRVLRIAAAPVETGKGQSLKDGIRPDIEARVPIAQERTLHADPYALLPGNGSERSTRPRLTEAELVRRRRGESDASFFTEPEAEARAAAVEPPQLRDPVLLQALDVLKGIAIVGPSASAH